MWIGALALAATLPSWADTLSPADRFVIVEAAQSSYDRAIELLPSDPAAARGLFQESVTAYRDAALAGATSGELSFNLGNALVQSGETGRAIAAYLDAQRLLPGDPRVEANLAHARSLVAGAPPLPSPSSLDGVAGLWNDLPASSRVTLAVAGWIALWSLVAAGVATGWNARVPWRLTVAIAGTVGVVAGATLGVDWMRWHLHPRGVLVANDVIARKGNGEGFAPAFTTPLPSGAEFTLVESRPGWYSIKVGDGQTGWIRSSDAILPGARSTTVQ